MNKQFSIDEKTARDIYDASPEHLKQDLRNQFGDENFDLDITDRVKTLEDACRINGTNPNDIIPFKDPKNADEEALNAVAILFQVNKALCGNWKADYSNEDQEKYYPWFQYEDGLGLSYIDYGCTRSHTNVGSRLSYPTSEIAIYAGKQFINVYRKFMQQ